MSLASQLNQMSQSLANNRRLHLTEIPGDASETQTTVGGLLRAARLRAGDELSHVGRDLRIKPEYLAALEDGRPNDLPGRAYAIGFLRTYANYLGLDVGECLGRFKSEFPSGVEAPAAAAAPSTYKVEDEVRLPHGTILIFLTLICMAIYGGWYLFRSANEVLESRVKPVPEALIAPQVTPAAPAPAIQGDPFAVPEESVLTAPSPVFETPPDAAENALSTQGLPDGAPTAADAPPTDEAEGAVPAAPTEPVAARVDPSLIVGTGPRAPAPGEAGNLPAIAGPASGAPLPLATQGAAPAGAEAAGEPAAEPLPAPEGPRRDFGEVVAQAGRTFGAPTRDNRVVLRAEEEVFVRVETEGAAGTVLFEGMLQPGELYFVPVRPNIVLVTRNGGAVEVFVDRASRGKAGPSGVALKGLPLNADALAR